MAQGILLVCNHCEKSIKVWDDGNPYYLDESGVKQYAYHPDKEREKCIGNDSAHLCLGCGEQFMVDSMAPSSNCPKCTSTDICATYGLDNKKCPYCKIGIFKQDPNYFVIS